MGKIKTFSSNLFLSLLAVLFLFVVFEVLAQTYLYRFADERTFKKYASIRQFYDKMHDLKYSAHRYIGYYPTPNYRNWKNRHNSLGYRGDEIEIPKPENQYRIVCIGGSTTYTNGIPDYTLSYPYLLEKNLKERGFANVKVVNAGTGGWTSWESLVNLEFRVIDLDPDMIIVYHAVNDINARFVWPPEQYTPDNSGMLKTEGFVAVMPTILEYSTFLRMLMIEAGITESHAAVVKGQDHFYGKLFVHQKYFKTYPEGIFKKVSAKEMLMTNEPLYFKRNISNIVAIAKTNGIKTVLASFAYSPQFKNPRASSEEYVSAFKEMNGLLKEIANSMDVYFFDFANLFPDDKRYYTDGNHVSEEGSGLKAAMFANYLVENNLIPSK